MTGGGALDAGFDSALDGAREETAAADVLVVGAGAAGLTAALGCAAASRRVVVLTKTRLSVAGGGGASVWAQGGVASALGEDDAPALHAADTLAAGAGLNDPRIVELLTGEGPARIRSLLALGAHFDRDAGGRLELGREAAHSRRRILHANGDATGAEVVRTLVEAVRREPAIRVVDETFALDLALEGGTVVGLAACHAGGRRTLFRAPAVVLATGGLGQLYLYTTNPREATADGLAMAARAGARLVDLEFVQFHPTALAVPAAGAPLPLLTEALRGEGAILVDERGTRFMTAVHPDRELAPRDVVARAIWARMCDGGRVYLDARGAVGDRFPERFPTVFALCRRHGFDPRIELLPVTPAAHYHMGGVAVDASGRTSLAGLWACGEVAATGAHGANRLASNSLLEALVFGARVAEDVVAGGAGSAGVGSYRRSPAPRAAEPGGPAAEAVAARLRRLMWEQVGVERDAAGLAGAVDELTALAGRPPGSPRPAPIASGDVTPHGGHGRFAFAAGEARNLLLAGQLVAQAALARRESRGGHHRTDYPRTEPAWRRRLFLTAGRGGTARFEGEGTPAGGLSPTPAALPDSRTPFGSAGRRRAAAAATGRAR